jgi:hypothetical protein
MLQWFQKWNGAVTVHKGLCAEIENIAPKYDVKFRVKTKIRIQGIRSSYMQAGDAQINVHIVPFLEAGKGHEVLPKYS